LPSKFFSGNPKFFISATRKFPTHLSYTWSPDIFEQNSDGTTTYFLQISQIDPNFGIGKYFIGAYAQNEDTIFSITRSDGTKEIQPKGELETFEVDDDMEEETQEGHRQQKQQQHVELEKEKTQIRISGKTSVVMETAPGMTLGGGATMTEQLQEEDILNLQHKLQNLPIEPREDEGVITCIIRLPNGVNISRKVNLQNNLQILHDYVAVQALPELGNSKIPKNFFFVVDFPRIEYKDMNITFQEAKLTQKRCNLRIQEFSL